MMRGMSRENPADDRDLIRIAGNRRCSQKDRGKMCDQPRYETHGSSSLFYRDEDDFVVEFYLL
jgi:hypothetical protein